MEQWLEHAPPTSVARVAFQARCHMYVEFVAGSRLGPSIVNG